MPKHFQRFIEIDVLRGVAIVGMIIYHFFFILDFYDILDNNMRSGLWEILARTDQFIFLTLVGISLAISRKNNSPKTFYLKQFRRAGLIYLMAIIVTISTYFFAGEQFVRFGILHFIATSILLLSFISHHKYLSLILGLIFAFLGFYFQTFYFDSLFFTIIGFGNKTFSTIDHFAIFPWLALPSIGIFLGNTFYKGKNMPFPDFQNLAQKIITFRILKFLGQHSLLIYMIHVPIIIALLMLLKKTTLPY